MISILAGPARFPLLGGPAFLLSLLRSDLCWRLREGERAGGLPLRTIRRPASRDGRCSGGWRSAPVLHRGVEIGEYVGGPLEVGCDDVTEVDGMVAGLHLACHPALQVSEGLFEERCSGLPGS